MGCRIIKSNISGEVKLPASKTYTHRAMICAALAASPTLITGDMQSDDLTATRDCLTALGAGFSKTPDGYFVTPVKSVNKNALLDCGESGSTLRFLLPVACALNANARFTGRGKLPERPISELLDCMSDQIEFSSRTLPLTASGKLSSGIYTVKSNVSSQFVSGLMLALAGVDGTSRIITEGEVVSAKYIDITRSVLECFGANVRDEKDGYIITGKRLHSPSRIDIEGDWSNAAFFFTLGALCSDKGLSITNLNPLSLQGDRQIVNILTDMGASITLTEDGYVVKKSKLSACTVDARDLPDLVPVLAVACAFANGKSVINHVERLKIKESNRLNAVLELLSNCQINCRVEADSLIIEGGKPRSAQICGYNDHRIIMSAAVLGAAANGLTIDDAAGVNKSYPAFFEHFKGTGGKYAFDI